jgi:hypothetical protein
MHEDMDLCNRPARVSNHKKKDNTKSCCPAGFGVSLFVAQPRLDKKRVLSSGWNRKIARTKNANLRFRFLSTVSIIELFETARQMATSVSF